MRQPSGEAADLVAESRWALRLLIAIALVYTCHRAFVLRIEYFDGYSYLANARAMLGDPLVKYDRLRPPLLALLELPGMLIVRASAPGSALRIIVPHCIAVLTSLLGVAAILWMFRKSFPPVFALLGTLLFVGGPYFVRYGAHVMADLLSATCAAITVTAYIGARERRHLGAYVLPGLAFGIGLLAKFPLVGLGPVLVAAEAWYAVRTRELDAQRWLGVVLIGAVGVGVFAVVQAAVYVAVFGREGLSLLLENFGPSTLAATTRFVWHGEIPPDAGPRAGGAILLAPVDSGESWRDWGPMALTMLGPTLLLAAGGLAVALVQREDRDVPMVAWLAVLGSGIVFAIRHNEARYLMPIVPAVIYFAVRAVEATVAALSRRGFEAESRPRTVRIAGIAFLGAVIAPGVRQAWLDRDPIFFSDVERRAALRMLESRRPPGRLVWYRGWHTFAPREVVRMREDEYFNTFVFAPFIVEYFIDERVLMPGTWPVPPDELAFDPVIEDGDAVLQAARAVYSTANVPPEGVPPVEVWQVRRLALVREANWLVSPSDPAIRLRLEALDDGESAVRAERSLGRWSVRALLANGAPPRRLADVTLEAGRAAPLGPHSVDAAIAGLVLVDVQREVVR